MLALCSYTAIHTTGGLDVAMAPTYKRNAPYLPSYTPDVGCGVELKVAAS